MLYAHMFRAPLISTVLAAAIATTALAQTTPQAPLVPKTGTMVPAAPPAAAAPAAAPAAAAPAAATPATMSTASMADCTQTTDKAKAAAACAALVKDAGKDTAKLTMIYSSRAVAARANGDLKGAFNALSQGLYADPNNAALWTQRADVRSALGQHFRSAVDYSVALKYAPNSLAALLGRGEQYRRLGALPKAIEDADAAIKIDPKSATAYANRAYAAQRYGRDGEAMQNAEEALKLDPKSALAYAARGFAKIKTDKTGALTDLKKALELDPKLDAVTSALKKLAS